MDSGKKKVLLCCLGIEKTQRVKPEPLVRLCSLNTELERNIGQYFKLGSVHIVYKKSLC